MDFGKLKTKKMNKKKNMILGGVLLLMIFLTFYFIKKNPPELRLKNLGQIFNEANINGELTEVGIRYHFTYFKIRNDTTLYLFSPITDVINKNNIFLGFAQPGDIVIKSSNSDKLLLIKDDEKYYYRFETYFFKDE